MKKPIKILLLLLLILSLVTSMVACNPNVEDSDPDDVIDNGPPISPPETAEKDKVFTRINDGLINAGKYNLEANKIAIQSSYDIMYKSINLAIIFEANYDRIRKQDSEILLRIYDYNGPKNKLLVYYLDGDLYFQIDGEANRIKDFGNSANFSMFYEFITYFDLQSTFFDKEFADTLNMLSSFVDNKMISVNASAQTVSISSINLDKIKDTVNTFFDTYFGAIDTKLDLLTQAIAGIDLSLFGNFEINTVDAKGLTFGFSGDRTKNIGIEFAGTTTTYTDDFSLKIKLGVADSIQINPNEKLDSFRPYQEGVLSYKGELFINSLNTKFDINIAGKLNGVDNTRNQLVVDVRSGADGMMGFYYKDEKLYINVDGITKMFLQGGVDLRAFNLPKAYVDDINLSSEYNNLFGIIRRMLADTTTPGAGVLPDITAPDNILGIILDNVTSTKDTITLKIDDKLLKLLIGDNSASLIEFLATKLGINKELLSSLLGQIDLTDMSLELSYNVKTKVIGVNVILNRESVMSLSLKAVASDDSFEVKYPDDFRQEEYKELAIPTSTNLTLSGEIRIQDKDKVDFSKLLGVFIGDVTGKNSQMYLSLNDKLTFTLNATSKDGINYVQATIFKNEQLLVKLSTATEDSNIYLIEFVPLNIKYKITRDGLNQAFDDLKEGNIFTDANILQIFSVLSQHTSVRFREDDIFFTLAPYTVKGVTIDPIKELLGISNLILDASAKISFGANPITENSNDYCVPSFVTLPNTEFESMYQATWHNTVDVMFNSQRITFQLSFLGDSAKLVTNQYYYRPSAKLLGQDIRYTMILTDIVNGTKLVKELKDSKMAIDPTMETPLPERISVWYFDGTVGDPNRQTLGSLPYEIVGFPYTKENIREALIGSKLATYEIIIGKGSIAEIRFNIPIEVLNRVVSTNENYKQNPIVDTVTIDPYQYSIEKRRDSSYSPFRRDLKIKFGSNLGNDEFGNPIYNIVELGMVDWDDSEVLVDYKGGEYYAYYNFNTLKVALKVIVETKEVDHIAITGEKNGQYTVDSLIAASYAMPTTSNSKEGKQIRIYFKTGRYRIIGSPTEGEVLPIDCDGYYPDALKWQYEVANNVTLEKTINPLANGSTNRNKTSFGDDIVGKQDVTMTVFAPSRTVAEMNDPVTCITEYVVVDNEVVDSRVEPIKYSAVSFEGRKVGEYYQFDPYEKDETKRRLPSYIYIDVEFAGEMVSRRYNITYKATSIVDMYGNILHPSNQQCLLMVQATLGEDGKNKQTITMIVDNRSGLYQSVEVENPYTNQKIQPDASGRYILSVDPYEMLKLPSKFTLIFPEESLIPRQTYNTKFMYKNGGSEIEVTQDTRLPYTGGTILVTTYVDKNNELGILKQEFDLYIEVTPKIVQEGTIIGLLDTQNSDIRIDTYLEESNALYNRLIEGVGTIGVKFKDNTTRNDLPVTWDNLEGLLDVLRGFSSEKYTLVGYIYNDMSELRQKVTVDFLTEDRAIKGISFNRIDTKYLETEVLSIDTDMTNKSITMRLKKPFAIEGEYMLNGNVTFGYVKPSQYLTYILSNVSITFTTDFMKIYQPFFQLPTNFDEMALNDSAAETTVTFPISKMSGGSAADTFTFILITTQDKVKITYISQNVDLFDENGAILYLDGYNISRELVVTYDKSGKIVYKNINWISQSDYFYVDADGNKVLAHKADAKIETINRYMFNPMAQLRIEIYTKLDNGQTIVKALIFLIKDIDKTQYMAKATDGNYNVTNGTITIDNPYAVYPLDIAKIPNQITPNLTEKYGIVGYDVIYGVQWTPSSDFATEGQFDQSKINQFVNAYANLGKKLFATAVIKGHNQNDQIVELYIDIKDINSIKLGHDVLEFEFDAINNENFLSLDPYGEIYKEYKGNFVLPKDLKVYPNAKEIYTQFGKDSGIKYYIYNNFEWKEITEIPYTNLGHALGDNYGAADGILSLKAVMPDSSQTLIRFNVLSRDVAEVRISNYGTKLDKKYYIDPYDVNTHTLPSVVEFVFRSGNNLTIAIEWEVGNAPFVNNQLVVTKDIYKGKNYTINSRLKGYGVNEQPFSISVIIVDRSLKEGIEIADYIYDNPIAGRVADLKEKFSEADYVALPTEYAAIAKPKAPSIKWNATDNDITYNGFQKKITGALGIGNISLQEVSIQISADKWQFNNISAEQANENVILFDPINRRSTLSSYKLYFTVYDYATGVVKNSSREVTFYPSDVAVLEEQRTTIDWRLAYNSFDKVVTFHIGNATKTNVLEVNNYRYQEQQLIINNKIKFQFDTEYRVSGDARLVVDPFNPVLPSTVDVLAKSTGSLEEVEIKNVKVSFRDDAIDAKNIYKMMLTGGEKQVTCYLTTDDGRETPFDIIVYYLNRRPETISTTNMYLSELGNVGNTYHPIKVLDNLVNNTFKTYFIINPIDRNIYDETTKTYKLPTSIKIVFDNRQVAEDINIINALTFYKKEIVLENVKWVLSREITLQGTKRGNTQIDKPIIAKIDSATYMGKQFTNLDSLYELSLNVMDKEVEYTSVSIKIDAASDRKSYQRANREFYIDPYEPVLPTEITIKFYGEAEMLTYNDIKWKYDDSIITSGSIFSGDIDKEAMNIMASIPVFASKLEVQFPIKPRKIENSKTEAGSVIPLDGGKIYVLKDVPIEQHIQGFDHLYYKFELEGTADIARVPLSFNADDLKLILTDKAGKIFTLKGNLGRGDKGNIKFLVEVIDPIMYNINTTVSGIETVYEKGGLVYDKLTVASDTNKNYIPGREETVLPKVILANERKEVLYIDNIKYNLNVANPYATLECSYIFLSESVKLSGKPTAEGGMTNRLTMSLVMPVETYDYTRVDLGLSLEKASFQSELGKYISTSTLPKAVNRAGTKYPLIWDLSNVNIYKAGSYKAMGYYRNTYGTIIGLELEIDIAKLRIAETDINIKSEWLNRVYSGIESEVPVVISSVLKSDGTMGAIDNYVIEYSIDGGASWFLTQPINVKMDDAPDYLIKITVVDVNYVGSKTFTLRLTKKAIRAEDISFSGGSDGPETRFEYNGNLQAPTINGVPANAEIITKYNGSTSLSPIDAGTYLMEVEFPTQRNYYSTNIYNKAFTITKKQIDYRIQASFTYKGEYTNSVVIGLPESGVRTTYYYSYNNIENSSLPIREAGRYRVTVVIDGGKNYVSANMTGDPINGFSGETYNTNLINQEFTIEKQTVVVKINTVTSEYLEDIKPFNSEATFSGIVGTDNAKILGELKVYYPVGSLTNKHMVGVYELKADILAKHNNYKIVGDSGKEDDYGSGAYIISANNAIIINNAQELNAHINNLKDGQTVKWYLRAGSYGNITIDKNASVSIIGSYTPSNVDYNIAVKFDSITVEKGAVLIDIVSMTASSKKASISIKDNARSVTVNRCEFKNTSINYLTGSIAIQASALYKDKLYVENTLISRYANAIFVQSGGLDIKNSKFENNLQGVHIRNDSLRVRNSEFRMTRGNAIYIASKSIEISIVENIFYGNNVGIASVKEIRLDIDVENSFLLNAINIQQIV